MLDISIERGGEMRTYIIFNAFYVELTLDFPAMMVLEFLLKENLN